MHSRERLFMVVGPPCLPVLDVVAVQKAVVGTAGEGVTGVTESEGSASGEPLTRRASRTRPLPAARGEVFLANSSTVNLDNTIHLCSSYGNANWSRKGFDIVGAAKPWKTPRLAQLVLYTCVADGLSHFPGPARFPDIPRWHASA